MNRSVISVGVPIYNVSAYIERCAISLMKQTYDNVEYLFVDDCTQDNSISILEQVVGKHPDKNVKILHHNHNRGLAAARNTVLDNATGEFIMWVDSDDWIEENAIEEALKKQKEGDYDIVSFGYRKIFVRNQRVIEPVEFLNSHQMCLSTIWSGDHHVWGRLIRKSLYDNYRIRCIEGANMGEDYQVIPILTYFAQKVGFLNRVLYNYNCANVNSYMNKMSDASKHQLSVSENVIDVFFSDKGSEYKTAIRKKNARQLACRVLRDGYATLEDSTRLHDAKVLSDGFSLHVRLLFLLNTQKGMNLYIRIHNFIERIIKG